ncbi:MAG: hypothetical protein IT287_02080, partial [Bdellovibrionaceae bacterium]|nr:hypothetical protein [Pseudobdellovibrionaceae bacterium]
FLGICLSTISLQAQQCAKDKAKADKECTPEKFKSSIDKLAALKADSDSIDPTKNGAGTEAKEALTNTTAQKAELQKHIALCNEHIQGCIKSCQSEAQTNLAQQQTAQASQNEKDKQHCESGPPEEAKKSAQAADASMGEMMKALAGLLAALGMGQDTPETPEQPLCTQNPNDPTCKTDTASNDSGSTLTSGEFRRDPGSAFAEGELGTEAAPVAGAPAAQTMSAPMAGGAAPNLGGGGGGGGRSSGGPSKEKKSDFDGTPKINLASGFGGGGGGGGKGGGGGSGGKSSGNPIATRTGADSDQNAGKIAQAAEDRLRGPASNEPLGGVSSVYYLDNFTKVEKRIMNERNTLQEH